jgi:integrase/recombinase XerC
MTDLIDLFLDHLKERGRAQRTIDLRRQILTRIDGSLPLGLESANADELRGWIYRDEWTPNTRASYWTSTNTFFTWATRSIDPHLSFNPMDLLPKPPGEHGLPRPITDDQLARILRDGVEPYRTWSILAAYEGMRCCEISRGDRDHITRAETWIYKGKRNKPRVIPTHPVTWQAAQELPSGPLAQRASGTRIEPRYVSQRTAEYLTELLGETCGLHRLRHWFATALRRAGKDILVIKELMGHSSLTSTQIYALVPDEERRLAVAALPTLTAASS